MDGWASFYIFNFFSFSWSGREGENELHLIRLVELWGEGWFFFLWQVVVVLLKLDDGGNDNLRFDRFILWNRFWTFLFSFVDVSGVGTPLWFHLFWLEVSSPQVEHADGSIRATGAQFIASRVPANLEEAACAAIRVHQLARICRPNVNPSVEGARRE